MDIPSDIRTPDDLAGYYWFQYHRPPYSASLSDFFRQAMKQARDEARAEIKEKLLEVLDDCSHIKSTR